MSKQIAPKNWVPAVWVIAIAMVGFAAIAGASHLRPQHNGNANVAKPSQTARSAEQRGRTRANLDALPLAFEANQGQTDPQVKYMARGNGYTAFLTANETVFAMQASTHANPAKWTLGRVYARPQSATQDVNAAIRMKLVGANPRPKIAAENELPGHSNYFIGNDPSKWQSGVKQYSRVSYSDVYPGVNLAFHGQQRQLEFDFIVAPGAKAESIRFNVAGAKRVSTDTVGNLVLSSAAGDVVLHKPITYQTQNNLRQPVPSHFVVANDTIGFEVGNYDRSRELVIDPSVTYSTYLGGNAEDDGIAIAVNGSGNAFITGETKSTNFPTMNGLYSSKGGGFDVFVTELSPDGSTLIYSTYIGGSSDDSGNAIAVDGSGNAFVAGGTTSANFPTQGQGTWQGTFGGGTDGFVLELNSTGSALTYSTFLGGSGTDAVSGLALDGSGNAYAVGQTTSTDFPTNNAKQPSIVGTSNGFVSKIGFGGSNLTLDYSTYLGGGTGDLAVAVAVDGSNQAYVTGATKNKTFPTTAGAFQTSCGSDGNCNGGLYDAFVTVFNAAGSNYVYSTFLGGEGNDQGFAIAVDGAGDAYLTGLTSSTKFPLQSAIQKTFGGGTLPADAFVTELNPTGSALVYSTYLGGTGDDTGAGIAVDSSKNVYVTGQTSSSNFPVSNATQATKKGQNDAFVTEISTGGSAIAFSTYLGGSLNEDTSAK